MSIHHQSSPIIHQSIHHPSSIIIHHPSINPSSINQSIINQSIINQSIINQSIINHQFVRNTRCNIVKRGGKRECVNARFSILIARSLVNMDEIRPFLVRSQPIRQGAIVE